MQLEQQILVVGRVASHQTEEAAVLSEIFFLKLEARKRAADDASRHENAPFVPFAPSILPDALKPNFTPQR